MDVFFRVDENTGRLIRLWVLTQPGGAKFSDLYFNAYGAPLREGYAINSHGGLFHAQKRPIDLRFCVYFYLIHGA